MSLNHFFLSSSTAHLCISHLCSFLTQNFIILEKEKRYCKVPSTTETYEKAGSVKHCWSPTIDGAWVGWDLGLQNDGAFLTGTSLLAKHAKEFREQRTLTASGPADEAWDTLMKWDFQSNRNKIESFRNMSQAL